MTGTPRRGRGRPREPHTDAAILRAALELFTAHGAAGASIEQIARRAGVGKLTVYRRWRTKEELLAAAVRSALGAIPEPSPDDLADVPYAEVAKLIEASLPAAAETLAAPEYRAMVAQLFGSTATHPELMAAFWENHVMPRRRAAHVTLTHAKQEGVLPADTDIEVLVDMTVGAIIYRLLRPEPLTAEELHRYLRTLYQQAGLLPAAR